MTTRRGQRWDLRIGKPEGGFCLAARNLPRDLGDVAVKCAAHKVKVAEYERFLDVESDRNDIPGVLLRERIGLLNFEFVFEQEFLIVC